mgnify:FL=1
MTFKVIGIAGPAQCGKDTAADFIIEHRPAYRKASFADPIKAMLKAGFQMTDEQLYGANKETADVRFGHSPRHMMQTLGTERGGELIGGDVWVHAMEARLQNQGGTFIIPDIRFNNEACFVRKYGSLIHIRGRENNIEETDHVSELGVTAMAGDRLINIVEDRSTYRFYVH